MFQTSNENLGRNVSRETQLLCSLLGRGTPSVDIDLGDINWNKLLQLASNNRVLYVIARELLKDNFVQGNSRILANLTRIVTESEERLDHLKQTLEFTERTLGNASVPYIVAKTDRGLPYVTFDIDVLVKPEDLERSFEVFEAQGAGLVPTYEKNETDVILPDLLRVDLHSGFFCHRQPYAAAEPMWDGVRKIAVQGVTVNLPNIDSELALMIGHTIHERLNVPLLEFLFLKDNIGCANWSRVEEEADRHGWLGSLRVFEGIAAWIDQTLFPESQNPLFPDRRRKGLQRAMSRTLSMPYMFTIPAGLRVLVDRAYGPRRLDTYDIGHFVWTSHRYWLTQGKRVPIYYHWFPFNDLTWP
jgi:hypothetical protein